MMFDVASDVAAGHPTRLPGTHSPSKHHGSVEQTWESSIIASLASAR